MNRFGYAWAIHASSLGYCLYRACKALARYEPVRAAIAFVLYCLMMVAAVLLLVFVILPTLDSGGIDGKFAFMISAAILILAWCAVMGVAHMIKHYVNKAKRDELDTVKLPKKEVRGSLSA